MLVMKKIIYECERSVSIHTARTQVFMEIRHVIVHNGYIIRIL